MEMRLLRYFLEAANEGSITRAAQNLHITQPSLSRQLAQLEEDLGRKLYTRESYGIHLTAAEETCCRDSGLGREDPR